MPGLDVLLHDLADPKAYPDEAWGDVPPTARRVEVVQTHISAVFLTATRAYKVKKPVRLWGLVDYGTLERRKHWCDEEVRLNRRLASDVYRGVAPIVERQGGLAVGGAGGDGDAVEWAVAHPLEDWRQEPGSGCRRRQTTIRQACRMNGINEASLLEALNAALRIKIKSEPGVNPFPIVDASSSAAHVRGRESMR